MADDTLQIEDYKPCQRNVVTATKMTRHYENFKKER